MCLYAIHNEEINDKKNAAETIRFIDYARERRYSMPELLKYELTCTSQFLTTECKDNIRLKKPVKASLSRGLGHQLPEEKRNVKCDALMTSWYLCKN